jgi:hypothetical protein
MAGPTGNAHQFLKHSTLRPDMLAASERTLLLATLQLAANNHLIGINAMNLKDRLGNVETRCHNRLHG